VQLATAGGKMRSPTTRSAEVSMVPMLFMYAVFIALVVFPEA